MIKFIITIFVEMHAKWRVWLSLISPVAQGIGLVGACAKPDEVGPTLRSQGKPGADNE